VLVRVPPTPAPYPDEDFEHFARMSGCCIISVEAMRKNFPRWRLRLAEWGIRCVPRNIWSQDPTEAHAVNVMSLLIRQASGDRDPTIEHELRNLTSIRPYKP
jgi:hypothetical protein